MALYGGLTSPVLPGDIYALDSFELRIGSSGCMHNSWCPGDCYASSHSSALALPMRWEVGGRGPGKFFEVWNVVRVVNIRHTSSSFIF